MRRPHRALLVSLGLACLAAPSGAAAQGASRCEESLDSPHGRNEQVCAEERARRSFNLFGLGDNAVAGLRTAASDITFVAANSDIGDQAQLTNPVPIYLKSLPNIGNRKSARFFEIHYYATAAPGDFFKARDTTGIASLQNVRGGGFTFMSNTSAGGTGDFHSAKDGTLGVLFSGAKSGPGSCLDQSPVFLPAGRALLAMSDCEATWPEVNGAPVWKGAPYFSQDSWIAFQQQVGKANFDFDFWRLPATLADPDRRFIGTATQTYGITSDHGRETRERFGSVIPGGRGDPQFDGYPLGLDWEFDANTFNVSSVGRLMVVQVRIINNSADVYGQGIDYDSLYVGLSTRWLQGDESGNGRRANVHSLPEYGAIVANELGRVVGCNGAIVPSYILSAGCSSGGLPARNTAGFKVGASGVIYFKSPIGDLRNKLLSNPSSPFYNPASPITGDTITYNRMSLCGFDCAQVQFNTKDMQRSFGTITAREAHALFGRPSPQNFTNYDWWALFKPYTGLDSRVDLARPRAGGGFNYCVLNGWNYTNRPTKAPAPAGGDTLFFDNCNPTTNTWTGLWADTLPDRSINWAFNNTWSGAGPFPLRAGDTTGFVFGIIAAPDSAQFMTLLKNSYDFYLDFYLGPGVPTAPRLALAPAVLGSSSVVDQWRVQLTLDYTQTQQADPSIPSTVKKLQTAAPTSEEGRLVALNPWLPDSIARKAAGLVDTIYIYKSCNGGRTFTATKSRGICRTDRAVDAQGRPIGTGWQAFATLTRDASGNFPATFTDPYVQGGQRYLYSFVAHRAPLVFTVLDSGFVPVPVGSPPVRGLITRQDTILEAVSSSLKTTPGDPSVVEVYVPVSEQAGARDPVVGATVVGPTPLTYHGASVTTTGRFETPLEYTVFFGDTLVVEERDSHVRAGRDSVTLRLIRTAPVGFPTSGVNTPRRVLRDTLLFAAPYLVPINYAGAPLYDSTQTVVAGTDSATVRKRKFALFGAVVATTAENGAGARVPFFASNALTGSAFQPAAAAGVVGGPPLSFSVTNRTGTLADRFWSQPGFTRLRAIGTPTLTFITDTLFASTGAGFGEYTIAFRDSEYGPGQPFTLNFADPAQTEAAVRASLVARVRADSTRTDTTTLRIINQSLGTSYTQADLVKLYVPFTIRNAVLDSAGDANVVTLAALRSSVLGAGGAPKRLLLGSGPDTLSVAYPVADSVWVPGTPLIFIERVPVADTLAGGVPREDAGGRLQFQTVPRVTFSSATIGCGGRGGVRCNAVAGRGSSDYVSVRAQQTLNVRFYNPFTAITELAFTVQPPLTSGTQQVTKSDLERVKVVPNPYVVTSTYEQGGDIKRIMFTHVPPQGIVRIYTAAGTFVQQLTWTPDMLSGTGDLFWDMRSREGFDVAPGLYLFTVEATGPGGGAKRKTPGRFIIIR